MFVSLILLCFSPNCKKFLASTIFDLVFAFFFVCFLILLLIEPISKTNTKRNPNMPESRNWADVHTLDVKCHCRDENGKKCGMDFTDWHEYLNHLQEHYSQPGKKWLHCEFCNTVSAHSSNFISHLSGHTGQHPFHCNLCGATATTSQNLTTHIQKSHNVNVIKKKIPKQTGQYKRPPKQTTSITKKRDQKDPYRIKRSRREFEEQQRQPVIPAYIPPHIQCKIDELHMKMKQRIEFREKRYLEKKSQGIKCGYFTDDTHDTENDDNDQPQQVEGGGRRGRRADDGNDFFPCVRKRPKLNPDALPAAALWVCSFVLCCVSFVHFFVYVYLFFFFLHFCFALFCLWVICFFFAFFFFAIGIFFWLFCFSLWVFDKSSFTFFLFFFCSVDCFFSGVFFSMWT